MREGEQERVLLVAAALYPEASDDAALYAAELARACGWPVLSLAAEAGNERAAWHAALDQYQPGVVLVLGMGGLPPDALLELREREIRYALFMQDYLQICPTRRLWHRRQEVCGGPGPGGFKCALCVAGARVAEWPAGVARYRHYSERWQVAMAGAEALIVASRSLRDAWIAHRAPAERLVTIPPLLPGDGGEPARERGQARPRSLVYAGGWDEAEGAKQLADALEAIGEPIAISAVGAIDAASRAELRAAIAPRHALDFYGPAAGAELEALLACAGAAAMPVRWQLSYGRLIDLAQRSGTPPVATAIGGIPERVVHGLNGYLAEPDDAGSLAEAIESALGAGSEGVGWDAAAARRQVAAAAAAGIDKLRALVHGIADDVPHAAARAEFAAELAAAQDEFELQEERAYGYLRSALEGQAETGEAVESAFDRMARAATRTRRVHLNHALACFHAGGLRSVLCLGDAIGDAARWFAAWGIDARVEAPSGLARRLGTVAASVAFAPDAVFLDRGTSADLDELRRRYPGATAVLAATPDGIQVL